MVKNSRTECHAPRAELCLCPHVPGSSWKPPRQHKQEVTGQPEAQRTDESRYCQVTCTSGWRCQMGPKRCPTYPLRTNTYPDMPCTWIPALIQLSNCTTTFYRPINTQYPIVAVVQSLSRVWLFASPWTAACQASLSLSISQSLPRFMSIKSMKLSNHLILCHLLLLLPSIFPSIRVFWSELPEQ